MNRKKRSANALLLAVAFLASLLVPGVANATSDYDDLLQVSPTLFVYTDGAAKTQKMDISTTWWGEFKQSYQKRVAQNIGWPTNFVMEFDDIVTSGGSWGVYMQSTPAGNLVNIAASRDPHAYCGFTGSAASGLYECRSNTGYGFVHASYFTHHSYGGNGCWGSNGDRCSENGLNVYTEPTVVTNTAGYTFVSIPNSTLSSYKFFYMNFDLDYPGGYEGQLIPTEPPPAKFVATGDSFSSGHGNAPFEYGTAVNGQNECYRSTQAYPRLLQNDLNLGPTAFVACSGATTANVLYGGTAGGSWSEPPQVDALSNETEVVTITIGGNDVAFSSYLWGCLVACGAGTPIYDAMMDGIEASAFKQNLKTTYEATLEGAPNADIYVVDYPYMSAENAVTCGPFDFSGARNVQVALNGVIADAVNEVGDSRLHYVPTNYTGSPFANRHLCTSEQGGSYFDITTMHPNPNGHTAYRGVVAAYLN